MFVIKDSIAVYHSTFRTNGMGRYHTFSIHDFRNRISYYDTIILGFIVRANIAEDYPSFLSRLMDQKTYDVQFQLRTEFDFTIL